MAGFETLIVIPKKTQQRTEYYFTFLVNNLKLTENLFKDVLEF